MKYSVILTKEYDQSVAHYKIIHGNGSEINEIIENDIHSDIRCVVKTYEAHSMNEAIGMAMLDEDFTSNDFNLFILSKRNEKRMRNFSIKN